MDWSNLGGALFGAGHESGDGESESARRLRKAMAAAQRGQPAEFHDNVTKPDPDPDALMAPSDPSILAPAPKPEPSMGSQIASVLGSFYGGHPKPAADEDEAAPTKPASTGARLAKLLGAYYGGAR